MKNLPNRLLFLFVLFISLFTFAFAQSTREQGIELYRKGDFNGAINTFKSITKTNSSDATGWYYLGLSYLGKNKPKDAIKSLKKAVEVNQNDGQTRTILAYAYVSNNNRDDARTEAQKALEINPKIAEAHYILGTLSFNDGMYSSAYDRANKAIELNPNLAAAYLLKSESLISSFIQQSGTVMKPANSKTEILKEGAENLEKYLSLSPANNTTKFYRAYLESIKFFAEYYNLPENQLPKNFDVNAQTDPNSVPLKIISKPRASYTDSARQSGVQGVIRLLVGFGTDRNIKYILVLKPLSHGLNETAVNAARQIKFEPATKDGKPIPVVKIIEYSFSIY